MDINKIDKEIIHDNEAMCQLGNIVLIKFEYLKKDIKESKERKYVIYGGNLYRIGTKEYKKSLLKMEAELEVLKDIIEAAGNAHKYLL